MSRSYNETAYGPIADSYAKKYGIPADTFRTAIRNTSNFDPMFNTSSGSGIAGLTNSSKQLGINVFDIGQSLDFAAQYMSKVKNDGNDWADVLNNWTGGDPVSDPNSKTLAENEAAQNGDAVEGDKPFWRYSSDDWKALFAKSAWTVLFVIVGLLIILATLYSVIVKGGDIGK